jgi:hypothetical protein
MTLLIPVNICSSLLARLMLRLQAVVVRSRTQAAEFFFSGGGLP